MIAKKPYEFVQESTMGKKDIVLPEEPSTWDADYTGVNDPSAEGEGVIAILQATGEKFAQLEADSKAQEASDEKDSDMKTNRKTALLQKLDALNSNKKHLTTELDAVNQYLKDLQPACVEGDSSYEDRKAARADEIAALRKAQVILEEAFKEKAGKKFLQIASHSQLA